MEIGIQIHSLYLINNGNGTFKSAVSYSVGTNPGEAVVADFNGDGKPDIVNTNHDSNTISVLLGNGNGVFQSAVSYGAGSKSLTAAGDFNRDSKQDIIIVMQNQTLFLSY